MNFLNEIEQEVKKTGSTKFLSKYIEKSQYTMHDCLMSTGKPDMCLQTAKNFIDLYLFDQYCQEGNQTACMVLRSIKETVQKKINVVVQEATIYE